MQSISVPLRMRNELSQGDLMSPFWFIIVLETAVREININSSVRVNNWLPDYGVYRRRQDMRCIFVHLISSCKCSFNWTNDELCKQRQHDDVYAHYTFYYTIWNFYKTKISYNFSFLKKISDYIYFSPLIFVVYHIMFPY